MRYINKWIRNTVADLDVFRTHVFFMDKYTFEMTANFLLSEIRLNYYNESYIYPCIYNTYVYEQ